jgi:hypothetical protein
MRLGTSLMVFVGEAFARTAESGPPACIAMIPLAILFTSP